MMKVYVRLYAHFTKTVSEAVLAQHPEGIRAGIPVEVDLPHDSTIDDLLDHLALPQEEIKVTFVNGRAQKPGYQLQPEDEVGIFPPIAGG